jgi:hypothetical protein
MCMSDHSLLQLYLFHLHVFFSVFFFVGVGLVYSSLKSLPPAQKKQAAFWTLGLATLGTALTVPFCIVGMKILMI